MAPHILIVSLCLHLIREQEHWFSSASDKQLCHNNSITTSLVFESNAFIIVTGLARLNPLKTWIANWQLSATEFYFPGFITKPSYGSNQGVTEILKNIGAIYNL